MKALTHRHLLINLTLSLQDPLDLKGERKEKLETNILALTNIHLFMKALMSRQRPVF
jgi:hypothetical protein